MTPGKSNFTIYKGSDFTKVIRWEIGPVVYKTISAIPALAPLTLTVTGHGMPNGWRFAIQSVKGMIQLNAKKTPPVEADYYRGTVVDANTIEVNDVNAMDYTTYTSGGVIQYNTPVDLNGYTARMKIKDKVGGTELLSLTTENGGIVIANASKTIDLILSATDSAAITWSKGVYDLEMVNTSGKVTRILSGSIKVIDEVTT
jgi:hypothetical protein